MTSLMNALTDLQTAVFEWVVLPFLFHLGAGNLAEDAFVGTGWFLLGLGQLTVMILVLRQLEKWRPVEASQDRAERRVDVAYTLIHRLGLFRLAMFVAVEPWVNEWQGQWALLGWGGWQLDLWWGRWWPGVTDTALFSFLMYLLLFDLFEYVYHRAQHRFSPWWALHAVHHSQQSMSLWSDQRNHFLDDVIRDVMLVMLARLIGMAPGQFMALVAITQLLESLAHANTRLDFGPWLGRCLVSPVFHRRHHMVIAPGVPARNYAVLFPVWDHLFGTADHHTRLGPTGIWDQSTDHGGRDYGHGIWQHQLKAWSRFAESCRPAWFRVGTKHRRHSSSRRDKTP